MTVHHNARVFLALSLVSPLFWCMSSACRIHLHANFSSSLFEHFPPCQALCSGACTHRVSPERRRRVRGTSHERFAAVCAIVFARWCVSEEAAAVGGGGVCVCVCVGRDVFVLKVIYHPWLFWFNQLQISKLVSLRLMLIIKLSCVAQQGTAVTRCVTVDVLSWSLVYMCVCVFCNLKKTFFFVVDWF